jgi:hypothetical protein
MTTAVEWLADEIEKHYIITNGILDPTVVMELKRQAKEMEKEQSFGIPTYNLDELAKLEYLDGYDTTEICRTAFKDGFQKALELLTFKQEP